VKLVPPRPPADFDGSAVRGNVLDVDLQRLTESQSTSSAECVQYAVIFLCGCGDNAGHYIPGEDGLLLVLDRGQINKVVIPLAGVQRVLSLLKMFKGVRAG
jgi:hypothetical protein